MDTKEEILNAAEVLFARSGYHASSMRAITESAGVNLALVNYHFGSKEALLEAVVALRLRPVNEVRLKRLQEIRNRSEELNIKPDLPEILRAYIEPVFGTGESERGWADFANLIGRAFTEPDETVQKILLRHMKPANQLMLELLRAALPDLSGQEVFWRYQFLIGALGRAIRMNSSPGYERLKKNFETDSETLIEMLVSFASAGMGKTEGRVGRR
ncbi:MAG: TetR family transcriptional regulator [Nitrospirae bacterium]|nr:TetR family transcriptional regulator [Nitrospirota bacterium]